MANKSAIKGSRRSPSQWRSLLAEFDGCGLSGEAFCHRQGISPSSFYRWQNRLTCGDADGAIGKPAAPAFLDLGPLTPPTKNKASLDLTLDLGEGLVLHLIRY